MTLDYPWPILPGRHEHPRWTGAGFLLGSEQISVLRYSANLAGWTDELTNLCEQSAGSNLFIDLASRRHAIDQLLKYANKDAPWILEVGCSSGFFLRDLSRALPAARIVGADCVIEPLHRIAAENPAVPLLEFDLTRCPLPSETLDAVVLLNVLEHIEDDGAALWHVHRILKPGGVAIIEVPAGPHLFDAYDKGLRHWRRYHMSALCDQIRGAGLAVVERSHLGLTIYPGFYLVKRWQQRHSHSGGVTAEQVVASHNLSSGKSPLCNLLMQFELALGRWVRYPFGIRCLVTCRRM